MTQLYSYLASGDSDRRASCRTRPTHFWHFWRQIKSLKTQCSNFPFVNLICFFPIINPFSWIMNAFSSEKRCPTSVAFWHQADWHTNLPLFQGARPDRVRVESSSCCFPRELVSFVRPRELVRFDPRHVTRSPIGKRVWVRGYNNASCLQLHVFLTTNLICRFIFLTIFVMWFTQCSQP